MATPKPNPKSAPKPPPKSPPKPTAPLTPASPDLGLILNSIDDLSDLRALFYAMVTDIAQTGSAREQMDLMARLAPYVMRDTVGDDSKDRSAENLAAIADIMASLWPGRCSNCGHLMSPHAAVDDLEDDDEHIADAEETFNADT